MSTESSLPPGVTIAPPPAALKLDRDDAYNYPWLHRDDDGSNQRGLTAVQAATAFPERVAVEGEEMLRTTKLFACSGSVNSTRYREATLLRAMPEMGWEEARVALNR